MLPPAHTDIPSTVCYSAYCFPFRYMVYPNQGKGLGVEKRN